METDRRGFFRIVGSVVALLSGRAGRAAAVPLEVAPKIHRATRNTSFGPVGSRRPFSRAAPPFNEYPGKTVVPLPVALESGRPLADVLRKYTPAAGFAAQSLSIAELSALLYHTNGLTDQTQGDRGSLLRRAAPSAGALYSGEVYVVAERVRGLEAGLYYYAVTEHRLIRLREGPLLVEVARALERPGEIENAAAAVLLSNVFGRYSRRYANRGYRYALIDSGHIGENLRLTASSRDLVDRTPQRFWDDALNDLLGVDGKDEAVCALHLLGRRRAGEERQPSVLARRLDEKQKIAAIGSTDALPERFHEATKLVPSLVESPSLATRPIESLEPVEPVDPVGLKLPAPSPSTMRVATAIRRRRSAGVFEPPPVSLPDLSFVLQAAQGNPALERAPGVEVYLAVHAVMGLDPGVYRYRPPGSSGSTGPTGLNGHRLVVVHKGELREALVEVCLGQEKAGSAAVGFAMAARLDSSESPLGDRRYRDLLLESGAIGQRIYLAAEAVGLAARNLAAYVDDRFNEVLRLDQRQLFALHLTMLGHGD